MTFFLQLFLAIIFVITKVTSQSRLIAHMHYNAPHFLEEIYPFRYTNPPQTNVLIPWQCHHTQEGGGNIFPWLHFFSILLFCLYYKPTHKIHTVRILWLIGLDWGCVWQQIIIKLSLCTQKVHPSLHVIFYISNKICLIHQDGPPVAQK